ncbi:transporter substrate-binding domain-containing protein [Treponema sp. OttesenSCG-928-L16]|nr:transporter substrate-binding domain-containing protein [Treponema sp. OttesenSCG-928-L16]
MNNKILRPKAHGRKYAEGILIMYIIICSLPLLLCCLISCEKEPPQNSYSSYPVYHSYLDIPGISQEEIRAIEDLKSRRTSFIYGMNLTTEAFYRQNNSIGGFSSLVCEWLTELFGIVFVPGIYDWDSLVAGLNSGEIDFSGELTATDERRTIYYMTDAIAERSIKFMRIAGSEDLAVLAETRPLRYAFLSGATSHDLISRSSGNSFEAFFVNDHHEAYTLLKSGSIDAFFEDGPAEAAFDIYGDVTAEDFFPLIYSQVSLTSGNPELEPIISAVQKCLESGASFLLTDMYNRGHEEYMRYKFSTRLTREERDYILRHQHLGQTIPIAFEYDNYPACFYNVQEEEWQGIAVDVLKEIESLTSLRFQAANEEPQEWYILLSMLEKGEAAMISELIRSDEREGHFLWPDTPYQTDYYALLSRTDHEDININQVLHSRIGLIYEAAYAELFNTWFPKHQHTITYMNTMDGFNALENGEIEFLMATRNLLLSVTNYLEKPGFKANIVFNRTYGSSFGFNNNEKILCSIISKAQSLVDTGTISDRWTRRVFDYRGKLARAQVPYLVGVSVLLACVLILLSILLIKNRQMGKQLEATVRERTKELEIQTEAAQVASRAKGEFLARMSHEIRTPLNAIIGMSQIIRKDDISGKMASSVEKISAASSHLLDIVNDILDMSKIESGKFVLQHEPFSLRKTMEEVVNLIELRCREKDIVFTSNSESIPETAVIGDRLRLKQVLINLLGNAVKFTPPEGKIIFELSIREESETKLTASFSVEDSGIGMSEEQVSKLFTPFEQTDSSIAVKYGGTGLGLAISRNLVNQMGGEITVQSKKDEGSHFTFAVTLQKTERAETHPYHAERSVPDLSGKRILLVEDIEVNRLILIELLAETHVNIDEAEDGVMALEMFAASAENYYGLIFMDIQMPVMDGYEATARIRAMERGDARTVPIIAMTANAYREDIERSLEAGMNGHLAKPIEIDTVMRILSEKMS